MASAADATAAARLAAPRVRFRAATASSSSSPKRASQARVTATVAHRAPSDTSSVGRKK